MEQNALVNYVDKLQKDLYIELEKKNKKREASKKWKENNRDKVLNYHKKYYTDKLKEQYKTDEAFKKKINESSRLRYHKNKQLKKDKLEEDNLEEEI
jgi:hypothetical protein